jgi:hypothetical protein
MQPSVLFRMSAVLTVLGGMFCCPLGGQPTPGRASEHFLIDHNRVFVELEFVLADGTHRKALAFVDSGDPNFTFSASLFKELHVEKAADLHVLFGGMPLDVSDVLFAEADDDGGMFTGMPVEANLPSTVLKQYDVSLDYGTRTLTLASPGSMKHDGVRVPCKVDARTGLASIQADVGGRTYSFAIDNGSAYTWIDRAVTEKWAITHRQWERGTGAVGDANMNGSLPELTGTMMRLPEVDLQGLKIEQVGALGVGPGWNEKMPRFFDWYSQKTPGPVVGFLGGNVLRDFRLEIDYANRVTYWSRERGLHRREIDQVGIIIRPVLGGRYIVIGTATKKGRKTVEGVAADDRLIRIDDFAVTGATMGKVLSALHGRPGETRKLELERHGTKFIVSARVTSF